MKRRKRWKRWKTWSLYDSDSRPGLVEGWPDGRYMHAADRRLGLAVEQPVPIRRCCTSSLHEYVAHVGGSRQLVGVAKAVHVR